MAAGSSTQSPSAGVYGGRSAEQRRGARRQKLLDAGLELLATGGWSAATVRGVCRLARLSPRFFYESFPDIDTLAIAVVDEIVGTAMVSAFHAMEAAGDDPAVRIRATIRVVVDELTEDPRRGRVAFVDAPDSGPLVERRRAIMGAISETIVSEIRRVYEVPEGDHFVKLTAIGLVGALIELLRAWVNEELAITHDQLIDDLTELLLANVESAVRIARIRAARN
jgi:AcrR family transcriptional regulator